TLHARAHRAVALVPVTPVAVAVPVPIAGLGLRGIELRDALALVLFPAARLLLLALACLALLTLLALLLAQPAQTTLHDLGDQLVVLHATRLRDQHEVGVVRC